MKSFITTLMRKLFCSIANLTVPSWLTLQGKPASFPPSAHGHPVTDLTGLDWNAVGGKPTQFLPSSHTHAVGDITGLNWGAVTGKPSTFPPDVHGHAVGDISGLSQAFDATLPLPLVRTTAQGYPLSASASETLGNFTIRLSTTTNFEGNGWSSQWTNEDFVFAGYNPATGARRWVKSASKYIYWESGYWYIYFVGIFGLIVLRAVGAYNANPAVLSYQHAPTSEASGGSIAITSLSGTAAGNPGTPAEALGQMCIVGDINQPRQVYVATQLAPQVWKSVDPVNLTREVVTASTPPVDDVLQLVTTLGSNRDVAFKIPNKGVPLSVRYVVTAGNNPAPLTASFAGGVLTYLLGLVGPPGSAVPSSTANQIKNLDISSLFPPDLMPIRFLPAGSDGTGVITTAMATTPLTASTPTTGAVGQFYVVDGPNGRNKYPFVCASVSPIKWESASASVVFNHTTQTWRIALLLGQPGTETTYYADF